MLRDVREGMRQPAKTLPSKYFYDERGSELFEQITELPEYYLTRAERALLAEKIPGVISRLKPRSLVELGAGSASKTRIILDAMRGYDGAKSYVPIDVSRDFLNATASQLRKDYQGIDIEPVVSDISEPFRLPPIARPVLFGFLGSTIGNFPPESAVRLLSHVSRLMKPGDAFLLGADLRKDPAILNAAYNDTRGVTAEFNRNILSRINRELGANFPLHAFEHVAYYSSEHHRIEMHLRAQSSSVVSIPGIGEIQIKKGETIRTELSYKYDRNTIEAMLDESGVSLQEWMTDEQGAFSLALARAKT